MERCAKYLQVGFFRIGKHRRIKKHQARYLGFVFAGITQRKKRAHRMASQHERRFDAERRKRVMNRVDVILKRVFNVVWLGRFAVAQKVERYDGVVFFDTFADAAVIMAGIQKSMQKHDGRPASRDRTK